MLNAAGELMAHGTAVPDRHLLFVATGRPDLQIEMYRNPGRLLLIGGVPFREQILMWSNFVARSHEE